MTTPDFPRCPKRDPFEATFFDGAIVGAGLIFCVMAFVADRKDLIASPVALFIWFWAFRLLIIAGIERLKEAVHRCNGAAE